MNEIEQNKERFTISSIELSPRIWEKCSEKLALFYVTMHQRGVWANVDEDRFDYSEENERSLALRNCTSYVMSRFRLNEFAENSIMVFTALQREATVVCLMNEMTVPFMMQYTPEMLDLVGS